MLREFTNLLMGRKKVLDSIISVDEVQILLSGLDDSTKIKTLIKTPQDSVSSNSYTWDSSKALEYYNKDIDERRFYIHTTHQIYKNEKEEKHYIDVEKGLLISFNCPLFEPEEKGVLLLECLSMNYVLSKN
ncbi:MAG: hypothetical protein AB7V77_04250 [Candidatus Woesearchaeota archaeon]